MIQMILFGLLLLAQSTIANIQRIRTRRPSRLYIMAAMVSACAHRFQKKAVRVNRTALEQAEVAAEVTRL